MNTSPTFTPQRIKDGRGWMVLVVLPDGRRKTIKTFTTDLEAEAWIANESDDWLAGIGEGR